MPFEDPYYVSPKNKKGVAALLIISLIIVFTPRFLSYFKAPLHIVITRTQVELLQKKQKKYAYKYKSYTKKSFKTAPERFDPNNYLEADWAYLGLSLKQVAVVMNFTKRVLYSNEDLKKIFVIPPTLFELIKDSTFYPARENKMFEQTKEKQIPIKSLHLNAAMAKDLEQLKGIGPFYAKMILKYRDALGGFVDKNQLLEVYKMTPEVFAILENNCIIDPSLCKMININTASSIELQSHPYLDWNQANSIVKIRQQKILYINVNELLESHLIDENTFLKLLPYLSL